MARGKRASGGKRAKGAAPEAGKPGSRLPLPSPEVSTNIVIADIVLRAAGGLLRDRLEQGLVVRHPDSKDKADQPAARRGIARSALLWGASSVARRSPLGLAVVAGGLAAKVLYDRGKAIEIRRRAKRKAPPPGDS
jgi:hypothetical protein